MGLRLLFLSSRFWVLVGMWFFIGRSGVVQADDYDFLLGIAEYPVADNPWRVTAELNDTGIDDEEKFHQVFSVEKSHLLADYDFFAMDYATDSFARYDAWSMQYDTGYFLGDWYFSSILDYSTEELRPLDVDLVLEDSRWGVAGYFHRVSGADDLI